MAEVSQLSINALERKVERVSGMVADIGNIVEGNAERINSVHEELLQLRNDFENMLDEQRKTAILQEAATELVRIRQEIKDNFGNYHEVRSTMLGVLQATDLALVKRTTISRVSEEIMLSTPEYWLAPCLVAVAAWIDNDRPLAERAIAEAMRRDREKTSLTMALICRRNNRTDTCYEWLSIYFSEQDSANFTEGTFTYIDAYVNGVFGPDKKHICEDYIVKWMDEISGKDELVAGNQEELWKQYCKNFSVNVDPSYPALKANVAEYQNISNYLSRIDAVDNIKNSFGSIKDANVDTMELKKKIDKNLVQLVSRYDEKEEPLRKEEAYFLAVRKFDGDRDRAKQSVIQSEEARKQKTLSLVEQMTKVIRSRDASAISEQKTAVRLLSKYIDNGFNSYMTEGKETFPNEITIRMNDWAGKTSDGLNFQQLSNSYMQSLQVKHNQEVENIKKNSKSSKNTKMGISIALMVIGIILIFAVNPVLGILVTLAGGGILAWTLFDKSDRKQLADIDQKYNGMLNTGNEVLRNCLAEWRKSCETVANYQSNEVTQIAS